MNNRKYKILLRIMLVTVLALCAMLVACNKEAGVSGISITSATPPRTTYVQGQELDLSSGTITAIVGGEPFKVPLNAEGVTVSGYDSSKLGKQTLTVTYKDQTTTFEVTVVARVVAEEYETAYFIGDEFNNTKGRLKFTKDDGSVTSINLNNPSVQVKSFDSSSAGEKEVVLTYKESNGNSHEIKFSVKIYDIGDITFKGPSKTSYWSHDTELSLEGGYLTVKANGNSELSKFVELSAVEYSGFDPSKATAENEKTPLSQTVTFTYAGKSFEFKISVTYSPISFVTNAAKELSSIDFSKENVTITEAQGKLAMEAISQYLELTQAKKNLVAKEDIEAVARPAAKYISECFKAEADKFASTFVFDESAKVTVLGASYNDMKTTLATLSDSSALFNVYAKLLREMKTEFKDTVYTGETKIADYITVWTLEDQGLYTDAFECMIAVHESLLAVPANWTTGSLSQYSTQINAAVYEITSSRFTGYDNAAMFEIVRNWRDKKDCFDIIYSYYCYEATDGHDFIVKNLWLKLPMPTSLTEWYNCFFSALYYVQFMEENATTSAYLYDTTDFMYFYHKGYALLDEINNGSDQLAKDLYSIIELDKYMDSNLRKATAGYIYQAGSMLSSEEFEELWAKYLVLIEIGRTGTLDPEAHAAEFEAVFEMLADLTPADLFGFISSLEALYVQTGGKFYAFDYSEAARNKFVACIASYYEYKLPAGAKSTFQSLLLAMECYSAYTVYGKGINAYNDFVAAMDSIATTLSGLSAQDRETFNSLLGDCYNKYFAIYKNEKGLITPNVNKYDAQLEELRSTIRTIYEVVDALSTNTEFTSAEKTERIVFLFSLYERAEYIYNSLKAENDNELLAYLFSENYTFGENVSTFDIAMISVRKVFIAYGISFKVTQRDENGKESSVLLWDAYSGTTIQEFLRAASYLFEYRFMGGAAPDKATVEAIVEACRNLSSNDTAFLYGIGINCYYNSLQNYYVRALLSAYETKYGTSSESFKPEATALVQSLLEAEIAYQGYYKQDNSNESFKTNFKQKMQALIEKYGSFTETEMCDTHIKALYEYYLNIYNAMN